MSVNNRLIHTTWTVKNPLQSNGSEWTWEFVFSVVPWQRRAFFPRTHSFFVSAPSLAPESAAHWQTHPVKRSVYRTFTLCHRNTPEECSLFGITVFLFSLPAVSSAVHSAQRSTDSFCRIGSGWAFHPGRIHDPCGNRHDINRTMGRPDRWGLLPMKTVETSGMHRCGTAGRRTDGQCYPYAIDQVHKNRKGIRFHRPLSENTVRSVRACRTSPVLVPGVSACNYQGFARWWSGRNSMPVHRAGTLLRGIPRMLPL